MSPARLSVDNPVLVNVVMTLLLLGGIYTGATLVREMFPESRPKRVLISAPYPGATPNEVERGLALRIEEAVKDIEFIDKVTTTINEGLAVISVELTREAGDIDQKVNEFKAAIDGIPRDELPALAEEIRVAKAEPRLPVISVTIFADTDEHTLKALGQRLRDELLLLPDVTDIQLGGVRKAELSVEIAPERLIEYGVSLAQVAAAIRETNLDLPAGQIRAPTQNVAVRTLGETDQAERIAETIVRAMPDGKLVRVGDLGLVTDGFEEAQIIGRFNGKSAVSCTVYKTGSQDAIRIARQVRAFVAGKARREFQPEGVAAWRDWAGLPTGERRIFEQARNDPYPPTVDILTHSNLARFIEGRLELLTRNGLIGLALVFGSLLLFLNFRVALWVMIGLVVAIAGTVILMRVFGESLNLMTMFGLIIVLGLIVDDAIVVGENIYSRIEAGESPHDAAIRGAEEVAWPVTIAVLTTIGAFLPLMFIEGRIGDFMGVLPVIVSCALAMSLFESLTLLPSHLAETLRPVDVGRGLAAHPPTNRLQAWVRRLRSQERHIVLDVLSRWYERLVRMALEYRYVTVAVVFSMLLMAVGLVRGGLTPFVFLQKMDSETLLANLDMPIGTPAERTLEAMEVLERAALDIPEVSSTWALVGAQVDADESGTYSTEKSHLAQLIIELKSIEDRERDSDSIVNELRERSTDIPGVNSLTFRSMQGGPAGKEIEVEITGPRLSELAQAMERVKQALRGYDGVFDLDDDYETGRREVQIELLESARALGLTTQTVATEIRGAFFGLEARTLQREREDVDIRVRFPEDRRRHVHELENMRIATPGGTMVPLGEVARITESRGATSIRRVDQRRAIVVSADVNQDKANADEIIADLQPLVTALEAEFPGILLDFVGNKRETRRSLSSLGRDFLIALVVIYFMLCALFKSYLQPVVVMTAVPFGVIGAIVGHWVLGYPLTVLSAIGIVALTGIVVNDSLVLLVFVNAAVRSGVPLREAVVSGCLRRLRPILLTSLTTILGLAPLMLEQSFQARFLIPMAISISAGLMFATVLTLVVVPANYLILADLKALAHRLWHGPHPPPESEPVGFEAP